MTTLITPLLFLFPLLAAEGKPVPKFPLGRETTYVTGPLDKEGYIDYEIALNERLGKGIVPEKNANVLLWRAWGPAPEGGKGMPAEFFKRLGIKEPPRGGDYFIGLRAFMADHLKLNPDEFNAIYDQQGWAAQRPWTAKDYPHLAAWLKANEKPLALVIEATGRSDYYNPLIRPRTEKGRGLLVGALLPNVQKCRELTAALACRAMRRVAEGKFDAAWQDLLACHRLGRHVARGATLIEALVGIAIEQIACNADLAYLERAGLTTEQIQKCLKELQALPSMPSMADKIDLGERMVYLDTVQHLRRNGPGALDDPPAKEPDPAELRALVSIYVPALRNGNRWYDRIAAALRHKDRAEREKELDKIEKELAALKKGVAGPGTLTKLRLGKDVPETVGKAIGDVLMGLMMPAARKVQNAADRAEQVGRNLHVAFVLAAYHREQGRYPAKLDELAPKYLKAVPNDLFSAKALVYRPSRKGYLLYSVGVNGKDEGGRWYDDEPPGDDPRVRMPLPALKRDKGR